MDLEPRGVICTSRRTSACVVTGSGSPRGNVEKGKADGPIVKVLRICPPQRRLYEVAAHALPLALRLHAQDPEVPVRALCVRLTTLGRKFDSHFAMAYSRRGLIWKRSAASSQQAKTLPDHANARDAAATCQANLSIAFSPNGP